MILLIQNDFFKNMPDPKYILCTGIYTGVLVVRLHLKLSTKVRFCLKYILHQKVCCGFALTYFVPLCCYRFTADIHSTTKSQRNNFTLKSKYGTLTFVVTTIALAQKHNVKKYSARKKKSLNFVVTAIN